MVLGQRSMRPPSNTCKRHKVAQLRLVLPTVVIDNHKFQEANNETEITGDFSSSLMCDGEPSWFELSPPSQNTKSDGSLTSLPTPYLPHHILGNGAQSTVSLVTWKEDNQEYALKAMKKSFNAEKLSQVKKLYQCLKSPNIITSHNVFSYQDRIHILLEYMDCGSLENVYQKAGKIPENVLSHIANQLLCGLAYLKRIGIVHRDIKPSNILVNKQGLVKISDLDLCKQLTRENLEDSIKDYGESTNLDNYSGAVGTINYMSPEALGAQLNLEKGIKLVSKTSFKNDIWSLGITIAECALGKNLFNNDYMEIMFDAESYISSKMEEIKYEIKENLFDFLLHALNAYPDERYSAEELLNHKWILEHYSNEPHHAIAQWLQANS